MSWSAMVLNHCGVSVYIFTSVLFFFDIYMHLYIAHVTCNAPLTFRNEEFDSTSSDMNQIKFKAGTLLSHHINVHY